MTTKLKNEIGLVRAENAYKSVLYISIGVLLVSAIGSFLMYLKTEKEIKDVTSKVVVINAGNVIEGDVVEVSPTELFVLQAQNVLRIGVEYMYSFSGSNYDDRLDMAKAYWGKSGKEIIQSYINDNVRNKVMQNNLRVDVFVKDLSVELVNGNYKGMIIIEQSFINADVRQVRNLSIECDFVKTQVSSKNAYGLVIENAIIKQL